MEDNLPYILIPGFIALIIGLAIYAYHQERKRIAALAATAARLGLSFSEEKDYSADEKFGAINTFCEGENRYSHNRMNGTYRGYAVTVFDYHYETYSTDSKGNRQTHHHHFAFVILQLPQHFPELRIYPENFLSKIGQALGFDDIDFESVEFSRAFTVRAKDKKFAYDICHVRMMEFLLRYPDTALEFDGALLAYSRAGSTKPEEVQERLDRVVQIRELMPDYVFDTPRE